ncbi:MAG: TlpA disulfide reductase family protein [Candidatus Korobacteraceae bacterium]
MSSDMESNSQVLDQWVQQRMQALAPGPDWQPDTALALARLRQRAVTACNRRKLTWTALAAGLVLVTVCLVVLPAPRVLAHRCLDCSVAFLQALSTPPALPSQLKPELQRPSAPDFTLSDASGKPIRLSAFKGKVVLLNFWATWCHGCQIEIPWFVDFERNYEADGLAAIGVSLDGDGWKSVKPYLEQKNVNYEIVIGNDDLANVYNANSLPVTVLIDRAGRIAARHEGVVSRETYAAEIRALLAESPDPEP